MLVLAFALEAFVVQELTTVHIHNNTINSIKATALRALIDLFFAFFLTTIFYGKRKVILYLASILEFILSLLCMTYYNYFKAPITFKAIATQFHEFLAIINVVTSLINPVIFSALIISLIIKFYIINNLRICNYKNRHFHGLLSLIFLFFLIEISIKTISSKYEFLEIAQPRMLEAYGYLNTFAIASIHETEVENVYIAQSLYDQRKNNLAVDIPLKPFKNLIVIQVESMDYSVLCLKSNGKKVMPFLDSMKNHSIIEKITKNDIMGSASSDYNIIVGAKTSKAAPYYLHPFFNFSKLEALPKKLTKFKSAAYHGCTGNFFSRRIPYMEMGFQKIYFLEDLEPFGFEKKFMGINDGDVFKFAINQLNTNLNDNNFIFIITLTSHYDFMMTPLKNIYPNGQDDTLGKKYINSINYLDQCLLELYEKLPDDTVIILYGDHQSYTKYDGAVENEIPLMIFQKGNDIHNGTISKINNKGLKLHDIHWLICSIATQE
jgi:phosphoglycerol transferase MdoB-like AlkP superfamily enzyme